MRVMLCIEHLTNMTNKPGGSGGNVESIGPNFGFRFIAFLGRVWQQLQNAPGGKDTNDRKQNKPPKNKTMHNKAKQANKQTDNGNVRKLYPSLFV